MPAVNNNNQFVNSNIVWIKVVPLKLSFFAWCLLLIRFPTKSNLFRTGVLHHNDQRCMRGCGMNEDVDQLFARCDRFGQIWSYVSNWLGVVTVNHDNTSEHLEHILCLGGFLKQAQFSLKIIWLFSVWVI